MRLSAKGRYALASTISLAKNFSAGDCTTVISISEKLGISKIYLEQVFALLKRGGIVSSVKGSQGGYQLTRKPQLITLLDILSAVELSLFETNDETVKNTAPDIEGAMQDLVYGTIDSTLKKALGAVSLLDLVAEAEKHQAADDLMYYI